MQNSNSRGVQTSFRTLPRWLASLGVFLSFLAPLSAGGGLMVSEVQYNPHGSDSGRQRVAAKNRTPVLLDLSRWAICLSNPVLGQGPFYYSFEPGRNIGPNDHLTIHWNASGAGDQHNVFTNSEGTFLFGLGVADLDITGFAISLYEDDDPVWSAGDFLNPTLLRDFVQVGQSDLPGEDVAVAAQEWINNDFVLHKPEGYSLVHDGTGNASSDWVGDPAGFVPGPNGIVFGTAQIFGVPCSGSGGFSPFIPPRDRVPTDSSIRWQLTLTRALGGAPTFLVVGVQQANLMFGGCPFLVVPLLILPVGATNNVGAGEGTHFLPAFTDPAAQGVTVYFTYILADPGGPLGTFVVSNALQLDF